MRETVMGELTKAGPACGRGGRRGRFALVASAALLLLLTACGTKHADTVEIDASPAHLASAVEETRSSQTGRFEMNFTMQGGAAMAALAGGLSVSSVGSYDLSRDSYEMTARVPAIASLGGDDSSIAMIVIGDVVYLRSPALAMLGVTQGAAWVRVDPREIAALSPDVADEIDKFLAGSHDNSMDPSSFLTMLRGASDDLHATGAADVRGVPTTELSGTFTLERALQATSEAEDQEAVRKALPGSDQMFTTPIAFKVWLDADDMVRRVEVRMPFGEMMQSAFDSFAPDAPSGTSPDGFDQFIGDLETVISIEYFDFGAAANIQPPPEDQTIGPDRLASMLDGATAFPTGCAERAGGAGLSRPC